MSCCCQPDKSFRIHRDVKLDNIDTRHMLQLSVITNFAVETPLLGRFVIDESAQLWYGDGNNWVRLCTACPPV